MGIFKKKEQKPDNMSTADKKQIVDKIVFSPHINYVGKIVWMNKFLSDTKKRDPKNKELLDYIQRHKDILKGGKK